MAVDICVKNMEHLSLPQDPAPSSPLLQGERGSSCSSSELSSSEGVCLERKGEKMRESEEKIEKSGKAESFPPILLLRCFGINKIYILGFLLS